MTTANAFLWRKFIYKVLVVLSPALATLGISLGLPADSAAFEEQWIFYLASAAVALFKAAEQLYKHWDKIGAKEPTPWR